jgi:hypothetical protein
MNIIPARFHKKKRALLVCKSLRRSWSCTSLDMAELDIYRFLLVHGYRQEVIGATPIWFGHITPRMLLSNYPFNPNVKKFTLRMSQPIVSGTLLVEAFVGYGKYRP